MKGLYKSKSGSKNLFYVLGLVDYIRHSKPVKDIVLYVELPNLLNLVLLRTIVGMLRLLDARLLAKAKEAFDERFEQVASQADEVDTGAARAVRAWEASQSLVQERPSPSPEIPQQPPPSPYQALVEALTAAGLWVGTCSDKATLKKIETRFPGFTDTLTLDPNSERCFVFGSDGRCIGEYHPEEVSHTSQMTRFLDLLNQSKLDWKPVPPKRMEEIREKHPEAAKAIRVGGGQEAWCFGAESELLGTIYMKYASDQERVTRMFDVVGIEYVMTKDKYPILKIEDGRFGLIFDSAGKYEGSWIRPDDSARQITQPMSTLVSMCKHADVLYSINTPEKWGTNGPRIRELFPNMHTFVTVHGRGGNSHWCFSSGVSLLGVVGEDEASEFAAFKSMLRRAKVAHRIFDPRSRDMEVADPKVGCRLVVDRYNDAWDFNDDGTFLGRSDPPSTENQYQIICRMIGQTGAKVQVYQHGSDKMEQVKANWSAAMYAVEDTTWRVAYAFDELRRFLGIMRMGA